MPGIFGPARYFGSVTLGTAFGFPAAGALLLDATVPEGHYWHAYGFTLAAPVDASAAGVTTTITGWLAPGDPGGWYDPNAGPATDPTRAVLDAVEMVTASRTGSGVIFSRSIIRQVFGPGDRLTIGGYLAATFTGAGQSTAAPVTGRLDVIDTDTPLLRWA